MRHLPLPMLQLQSTPDPKVFGRPLPHDPSRSALVVLPHLDVFLLLLACGLVASRYRLWDSLRLRSLPGVRHTLRRFPLDVPGDGVTTTPDPLVRHRCVAGASTVPPCLPCRSLAEGSFTVRLGSRLPMSFHRGFPRWSHTFRRPPAANLGVSGTTQSVARLTRFPARARPLLPWASASPSRSTILPPSSLARSPWMRA